MSFLTPAPFFSSKFDTKEKVRRYIPYLIFVIFWHRHHFSVQNLTQEILSGWRKSSLIHLIPDICQVEFLYWCAVLMSVIVFRVVWQTVLSRSLNPSWHKVDARFKSPNDWKWTQYRGGWQGWFLSWQRVLKTARSCAPLDLSSKSATMRIDWEPLSERIHLQCIDLGGFIENKCTIHVLCQQRVRYNFVSIIQQICISHLC